MKTPRDLRRDWLGGFIRYSKKGHPTFVIRKRVGSGKQYKVSTRCHTETGALAELKRFEADPPNYVPGGVVGPDPIYLDKELAKLFLIWSKDDLHNSIEWVRKQRSYLAWWGTMLKGVDLRRATLAAHIMPALDSRPKCRAHLIAMIKNLYAWLRVTRNVITPAEDPTFGKLKVPQSMPEQWKREKAVPSQILEKVRSKMKGQWRDGLTVLMGTGWHVTELVRFVKGGRIVDSRRELAALVAIADEPIAGPAFFSDQTSLASWIWLFGTQSSSPSNFTSTAAAVSRITVASAIETVSSLFTRPSDASSCRRRARGEPRAPGG